MLGHCILKYMNYIVMNNNLTLIIPEDIIWKTQRIIMVAFGLRLHQP